MSDLDRFEHDADVRPHYDYGKIVYTNIPVGPEAVIARYFVSIPHFSWRRPASWWPWLRWRFNEWRLDISVAVGRLLDDDRP